MSYKLEAIDPDGEFSRISVENSPFCFSHDMRRDEALELAENLIRTSFRDRDFGHSEICEWLGETFPFLEKHFVDDKYEDECYYEFTKEELNDE